MNPKMFMKAFQDIKKQTNEPNSQKTTPSTDKKEEQDREDR